MSILYYGVGYDSGGYYPRYINSEETREFSVWKNMLARCHGKAFRENSPTYKHCSNVEEWNDFQVFAKWCHTQDQFKYIKWQLDKDILKRGNSVYGPEFCRFVPHAINSIFLSGNQRSGLPKGVHLDKGTGKYRVRVNSNRKKVYDKFFLTSEEALQAYWLTKKQIVSDAAEFWRGKISEDIYEALINWETEITN